MLIRIENNLPTDEVIGEGEFFRLFPAISFPANLEGVDLNDYGYARFEAVTKPQPVQRYEKITPGDISLGEDGVWRETWVSTEMSPSEKLEVDKNQAFLMREQRNFILARSDWTQVPDAYNAGVDIAAWAAYRQELRDITEQPGFPWEITWPTEPEPLEQPIILDYRAFYDALLISPAYSVIRSKAVESTAVLTACVEFIAAIGDAKSGRPNSAAIQVCVDLLCAAAQFTEEELQALGEVMTVGGLDQVYSLSTI